MSATLLNSRSAAAENRAVSVSCNKIRLTPRGKKVFGIFFAIVFCCSASLVAANIPVATATSAHAEASLSYIVPIEGDTLWSLAAELDPNRDPRELVAELIDLNRLESAIIIAQQPLAVPGEYRDSAITVSASEIGR